jgi:LmbE family N-acetylglucosaminyl deacetylase
MRARSRSLPRDAIKSALVVAPHPDDETLGCGGTLALLTRDRAAIHVIFVTDGSASHPAHPNLAPAEIAAMRKVEARAATGALGVEWANVFFMEAPDGKLASLDGIGSDEISSRIAAILTKVAPEVVLLPIRHDGSTDHEASFILVQLALQKAGQRPRLLEFPIWAMRNPLLLLKPMLASRNIWRIDIKYVLDRKAAAIDAYVSQIRPIPPDKVPVLSPEFTSEFTFGEEFLFER